jgi:hypothetical protein
MSRSAQAAPSALELDELQDQLDDAKERARSATNRLRALEVVVTHLAPALQEALRLTTTAHTVHHALEVYQGGAPGGPVADLQRALGGTLLELRNVLEANLAPPTPRRDSEEDTTGPIVLVSAQPADAEGATAQGRYEEEEE